MPSTFTEKVYMQAGLVVSGTGTVFPDDSVGNAAIKEAEPIGATKLQHRHVARMAQVHGSAASAERRIAHIARGAGVLTEVKVSLLVAAVGGATVTIDVKKNGATMLTGTVGLTSADVAYATASGVVSGGGAYAAGDVIEIVQTVAAGGGTLPQGVCTELILTEAA